MSHLIASYEMPLATALEAFAALEPYMSPEKDATPVLRSVRVREGVLVATDRYGVARYRSEHVEDALAKRTDVTVEPTPSKDVLLPAQAVSWIAKTARNSLRDAKQGIPSTRNDHAGDWYGLRIDVEAREQGEFTVAEDVTVSVLNKGRMGGKVERSQSFEPVAGNFPPIDKLMPSDADAERFNAPDDADDRAEEAVAMGALGVWQIERLSKVWKKFEDGKLPLRFTPIGEPNDGKSVGSRPVYICARQMPLDMVVMPNLVLK